MVYQDLYWNSGLIYLAGVLGFSLVIWKLGTKIPWRPLRWWLSWIYLCVVLTPWKGSEPEEYYAPAIIVAAFDFLDEGLTLAMVALKPMVSAIVVGSAVIVFIAIAMRIKAMRSSTDRTDDSTEHEGA
jgi:hypothetical protein